MIDSMLGDVFKNGWDSSKETTCGKGSEKSKTAVLSELIPDLCYGMGIETVVDIGAGDLNWFPYNQLTGTNYIGVDKYPRHPLVRKLDALQETLPSGDLYFCRDVMIHLPNLDAIRILTNIVSSSRAAKIYLIATTFTGAYNQERATVPTQNHEPLDLSASPFGLGRPMLLIPEYYPNKYCGLWRLR